jgi:hypothetical protein
MASNGINFKLDLMKIPSSVTGYYVAEYAVCKATDRQTAA